MQHTATHLKIKSFLLLGCFLAYFNFTAQTNYTWTGSTSSDWNTASNFSPNGIPTSVDNVAIGSSPNNPSLSGSVSIAGFSISSATLTLNGYTLISNYSATFSGSTITNGSIQVNGPEIDLGTSEFNASITAVCADVFFHGSTFNQPVNVVKTGSYYPNGFQADDYSSGGNIWNADLTLTLTGTGALYLANNFDDHYNGNIIANSTNTNGSAISTGVAGGNGGVYSYLAPGKTITIGSQGFNGAMDLLGFIQQGNTPQNLSLIGPNSALFLDEGSVFNGDVNFFATRQITPFIAVFNGSVNLTAFWILSLSTSFNGPTTFTNTGNTSFIPSYGGNIFNNDLIFNQVGTGLWVDEYYFPDIFKGNITVNTPNNGVVEFGYNNGGGYKTTSFTGLVDQNISGSTNNLIIDNLQLNKTSGNLILTTNVEISTALNLQSGKFIVNSGNLLKLDNSIQVTGASSRSFIDGPVQYTGNTAFTFPCGNGSDYNPISISAPANITDAFTAQFFHSPQTIGAAIDTGLTALSNCEYWNLIRTAGTDNVAVSLGWNSGSCEITSDVTQMRVAEFNTSSNKWTDLGGINPSGSSSAGTITSSSVLTTYGALALANSMNSVIVTAGSGSSVSICSGNSIVLSASGGTSYNWSPATGLSSATISKPVANPTTTTTYTVTISNSGMGSQTGTVTVTVNPLPNVVANTTASSICGGGNITLTGSGAQSYTWSGGATDGVSFSPSSTTTYSVIGTNSYGCSGISNVTVTVTPNPIAQAGPTTTICANASVSLTAGANRGASYAWSPVVGLNNSQIASPTASPLTTTTYTVTVTNGNCSSTSSVTITVIPAPMVSIAVTPAVTVTPGGNPNTIYTGHGAQSLTLTASVDANTSSYSWAKAAGLSCGNCLVATAKPSVTTTYTFTAINANGCITVSTITIYVVNINTACSTCSN